MRSVIQDSRQIAYKMAAFARAKKQTTRTALPSNYRAEMKARRVELLMAFSCHSNGAYLAAHWLW